MLSEIEVRDTLKTILPFGLDLGSSFKTIVNAVGMHTGLERGPNTALHKGTVELLRHLLDHRLVRILDCDSYGWPVVEGSTDEILEWILARWKMHDYVTVSLDDVCFYETTKEGQALFDEIMDGKKSKLGIG